MDKEQRLVNRSVGEIAFTETASFNAGLAVRKDVVGTDYVTQSMANVDAFMAPMQQLATEFCWGSTWARPGLDRKFRSLLTLGLLAVFNRSREFELHVRGAIRNGATEAEIQEVLLQVAVYAGVPVGIEGFRLAREVLAKIQAESEAAS